MSNIHLGVLRTWPKIDSYLIMGVIMDTNQVVNPKKYQNKALLSWAISNINNKKKKLRVGTHQYIIGFFPFKG